jgi:hypothetical protein
MLRARRCGTAFMWYLRIRDEMLRSIPDFMGHLVIPDVEMPDESGINRAATESTHVRDHIRPARTVSPSSPTSTRRATWRAIYCATRTRRRTRFRNRSYGRSGISTDSAVWMGVRGC